MLKILRSRQNRMCTKQCQQSHRCRGQRQGRLQHLTIGWLHEQDTKLATKVLAIQTAPENLRAARERLGTCASAAPEHEAAQSRETENRRCKGPFEPGRRSLQKHPRETKAYPPFVDGCEDLMRSRRRRPHPPNQQSSSRSSTSVHYISRCHPYFILVCAAQQHFSDLMNLEGQGEAVIHIRLLH